MAHQVAPDPQADEERFAAAQSAEEQLSTQPQQHATAGNQFLQDANVVGTELEADSSQDTDSTLGDDSESYSTSLASSVREGVWEGGRRYNSYRSQTYHFPNDDEEKSRLELQHRIWYIALNGRLLLAPLNVETLREALDLGCGTGAWAIDFADAYPNCKITGTDLSPIQPTSVPQNAQFIVDDANADWAFGQRYDYIHTRSITSGIKDWDKLLRQAFEHLNPGGWVELHELHMPIKCDDDSAYDSTVIKWSEYIMEASAKFGIDMGASLKHVDRLRDAGFTQIQETHIKWPIGSWPKGEKEKQIGVMFQEDLGGNLEGISRKVFTQVLGMSEEEFKALLKQTLDDMYNPRMHTYFPVDIFWAQKPF